MYGQPSYYNPNSNYGLAQDWKKAGLQTRPEFVKSVRGMDIPRPQQNKMIREFWGPGGQPAYNSPMGESLANNDPVGTFYRMIAGGFSPDTAYGRDVRNQYDEVMNSYRAALQHNPLLSLTNFLGRGGISNLINQRFDMMTPLQRGEMGPSQMVRWV